MGHVPAGPVRLVGAGGDVQGRQHRRAPRERALAIAGAARSQALGQRGEDRAAAWYQAQGYTVVARNWRCRAGEIDLIARRGPTLVFCEVKTRTSDLFGTPAEAVTPAKQARIRRLAMVWLRSQDQHRGGRLRFDVAAVTGDRVEVLEGVF